MEYGSTTNSTLGGNTRGIHSCPKTKLYMQPYTHTNDWLWREVPDLKKEVTERMSASKIEKKRKKKKKEKVMRMKKRTGKKKKKRKKKKKKRKEEE